MINFRQCYWTTVGGGSVMFPQVIRDHAKAILGSGLLISYTDKRGISQLGSAEHLIRHFVNRGLLEFATMPEDQSVSPLAGPYPYAITIPRDMLSEADAYTHRLPPGSTRSDSIRAAAGLGLIFYLQT